MRKILLLALIIVSLGVVGCSDEIEATEREEIEKEYIEEDTEDTEASEGKIEMPYGRDEYLGSKWTQEELVKHFEDLGFTSIEVSGSKPDLRNYDQNIFELYVEKGLFSTSESWEAGEFLNADDTIKIYYNEWPIITVDNNEDLKNVLTSVDIAKDFAYKYDGHYIKVDGYVFHHLTYWGDTSHIIEVRLGDKPAEEDVCGIEANKAFSLRKPGDFDQEVEEGDKVTVIGKVNKKDSKLQIIAVDAVYLKKR